jgi:hypothetical protein
MKRKSQAAIEYMMIFSIVAAALIPVGILIFRTTQPEIDSASAEQVYAIGLKIMRTAENLFYTGHPSKITFEDNFPVPLYSIEQINNTDNSGNVVFYGINLGLNHETFVPVITRIPIKVRPTRPENPLDFPISSGVKRITMETNLTGDSDKPLEVVILIQ